VGADHELERDSGAVEAGRVVAVDGYLFVEELVAVAARAQE